MASTVTEERFKITLALGEAWAANSQGDSKLFSRLVKTSGAAVPSAPLAAKESLTAATDVKTAALWCDRVWGSNPTIPKEVRYWHASPLEVFTAISTITLPAARDQMAHRSFISDAALVEFSQFIGRADGGNTDNATKKKMVDGVEALLTNLITSGLAKFDSELKAALGDTRPSELYSLSGLFVERSVQRFQQAAVLATAKRLIIPIYRERQYFEDGYKAGDRSILTAIIRDVALVEEDKLEWEQVLTFRADAESRKKFRRFVHWFDADCVGKSEEFIREHIELRLEDYEAALSKHGIKTWTGALGIALDKSALLTAAIGAGVAVAAGAGSLLIAAGAILPLAGMAALEVVNRKLDLDDVRHGPNSEVAFIHELKKLAEA